MAKIQRVFYTGNAPQPFDASGIPDSAGVFATSFFVSFITGNKNANGGVRPAIGEALTIGADVVYLGEIYGPDGYIIPSTGAIPDTGVMLIWREHTWGITGTGQNITHTNSTDVLGVIEDPTNHFSDVSVTSLGSFTGSYRGNRQLRGNFRWDDTLSGPVYTGYIGDFAVGVPAPVTAPTIKVTNEGSATDLDADSRVYVMTYVNAIGYESAPGPTSGDPVHIVDTSAVTIVAPKLTDVRYHATPYGQNIIHDYVPIVSARIYRTNTGTAETGYQLVREVNLSTVTQLFDDIPSTELGELLITDSWDVPPPYAAGGCKMSNGTYILVNDHNVYMSVPGVVYAYPVLYSQIVRDNLIHAVAVGSSAIALSDGNPYLIAGSSPDAMEVIRLPFTHPCLAVRAVSVYLDLVIYPAPDGLIGISASGKVINLTENIYEEQQWRDAYSLDEFRSVTHDGVYYAWDDNGIGFGFDIKKRVLQPLDGDIFTNSWVPQSAWYDSLADRLYISTAQTDEELYTWQPAGDSTHLTSVDWVWESKEFYVSDNSYGAAKLTGILDGSNTVELTLMIDGVDTLIGTIDDERTVRLPALRGRKYVIKLRSLLGSPEVHTFQMAVHPTEFV